MVSPAVTPNLAFSCPFKHPATYSQLPPAISYTPYTVPVVLAFGPFAELYANVVVLFASLLVPTEPVI